MHETPFGGFAGTNQTLTSAGYIGNPEVFLVYTTYWKWAVVDPFHTYALAHGKTSEAILPNFFVILQLDHLFLSDGYMRWLDINVILDMFTRVIWFFSWWMKAKLVIFFDFIFAYTDGTYCSYNFWFYSWSKVIIHFSIWSILFWKCLYIKKMPYTLNLNLDTLILFKKYLSFNNKNWKIFFNGINC